MVDSMGLGILGRFTLPVLVVTLLLMHISSASAVSLDIMAQIGYVKGVLSQAGPALSATLFVLAGIFYAIGQVLPPDKKANFHTTAINIIIGAVVVGALSVASNALALASSHLLSNITVSNFT